MFEALGNAFLSARQKACERALQALINRRMERFGQVTELEIDSRQKKARIVVSLKGESAPVEIQIESYQLQEVHSQWCLSVQSIRTSREWLTAVLEEFVTGRQFPVPAAAKLAL
jgi:hypothetical protein